MRNLQRNHARCRSKMRKLRAETGEKPAQNRPQKGAFPGTPATPLSPYIPTNKKLSQHRNKVSGGGDFRGATINPYAGRIFASAGTAPGRSGRYAAVKNLRLSIIRQFRYIISTSKIVRYAQNLPCIHKFLSIIGHEGIFAFGYGGMATNAVCKYPVYPIISRIYLDKRGIMM